ncbi:MAG: NAD(P)/FAD-dependent oxidoreductase [Lachnospiraceae bacterium]|nr:NAD(P)/FAD-dependent oxidoreductase [Lachnospiraceae bacterium]
MPKKLIIIGGGSAGCFAAITAAESGAGVTLIEKNPVALKKILATGNGRCNYCHDKVTFTDLYRPEGDGFLNTVMKNFSPENVLDKFRSLGITPVNKDGYIYPYSEQARAVSDVLKRTLAQCGVSVITDTEVTDIIKKESGFTVVCADKEFDADAVILTTGGKAAPNTGSDGRGFDICKTLGHKVITPVPALTYLVIKDHPYKKAAGTRLSAKVSIEVSGRILSSDTGQIQITKNGISGIPSFNICRFASRGLLEKEPVRLHIRLVPDMDEDVLKEEISERLCRENTTPYEALTGLFPDTFADSLLRNAGTDPDRIPDNGRKAAEKLFAYLKDITLCVSGTGDFADAQVTCGGVSLDEVDPSSMESKLVPGLYLAGEILDMDGKCGGYNLYFAWASGYIAGKNGGA